MIAKTEVIICAEVEHFLALNGYDHVLRGTDHTLNFVSASGFDISNHLSGDCL
jgi:hypothetical protein